MPAIVSIVGKSKSGKTTLIEKLIPELTARGYRVGTIKHAPRGATFDQPEKDSWRHIQAGSEATVIRSRDRLVLIKPIAGEVTLEAIARLFGEDCDIVLAEGFKQGSAPKIEVYRKESGPRLSDVKRVIAVVTDEPLESRTRRFSLSDITGLADFLEEGFIRPGDERVSLYVNDTPIALSAFPRQFISNLLVAMASSLRGVGEVKSLAVFLKKSPRSSVGHHE